MGQGPARILGGAISLDGMRLEAGTIGIKLLNDSSVTQGKGRLAALGRTQCGKLGLSPADARMHKCGSGEKDGRSMQGKVIFLAYWTCHQQLYI